MWKYFSFVLILVVIWFVAADWGVSKLNAEYIQREISNLQEQIATMKAIYAIEKKTIPENKKWRK